MKGTSMDRLTVLGMFSWQYLLMAFLACLGVIQIAAARSRRRHLWLLRNPSSTTALGIGFLAAGFAFFYLVPLWTAGPWGPPGLVEGSVTWAPASPETLAGARNINDTAGGLSGYWQALWFTVAWFAAAFFARAVGRRRGLVEEKAGPYDQEQRARVDVTSGGRR